VESFKNKEEAFKNLLDGLSDKLSNAGCNDFVLVNTPENFAMIEEAGARNLRCKSVEDFRKHPEYDDYKPMVVGNEIYTQDYVILGILMKELNLSE